MFSQALRMGTAKIMKSKETGEEDKEKSVKMERNKVGPEIKKSQGLAVARAYRQLLVATPRSS